MVIANGAALVNDWCIAEAAKGGNGAGGALFSASHVWRRMVGDGGSKRVGRGSGVAIWRFGSSGA